MSYTYEDVIPPIIENTVMQKRLLNGVHKTYLITPAENYVLHDAGRDYYENFDDEGNPIGEPLELGYTAGTCTCGANYDFVANPRQFYAVLRSTVPEDQITGDTTPPAVTE